jgi:hypothetical protein
LAGSTAALANAGTHAALFAALYAQLWVVYAKRPFAGPEQVLAYLGRYTHRIALTNNRLVSLDDETVRFRYPDYAAGNRRKVMALDAHEFIRRYLLHVLPKGFMRIRHHGLLGNRAKRYNLAQARTASNAPRPAAMNRTAAHDPPPRDRSTRQRSRTASPMRAALTTFQPSAIVKRIAIGHWTPIRAPHAPRHPRLLLPLPQPGAPRL